AGTTPQLPRLYGRSADFPVRPVPPGGPDPLPTPADVEPYLPWLAAAVKERNDWVAGGLHRRAPRVVQQYGLEIGRPERRRLAETADGFRTKVAPGLTHPEILTLDLIAGLDPKLVARWPSGTIRRLLLAAQAAEEAAAADGRCLPWVRDEIAAADETRRKA